MKEIRKEKNNKRKVRALLFTVLALSVPGVAFAESTPTLNLNFDITQMFTWAQAILDAMMPIVYVTMGVGLGFLIVRALKSAFN